MRAAVGGRYILQQAAGIKPDDQTKNYRNQDQSNRHAPDLRSPVAYVGISLHCGKSLEVNQFLPNLIHPTLPDHVQIYVQSGRPSRDRSDDRNCKPVFPSAMQLFQVIDFSLPVPSRSHGATLFKFNGQLLFSGVKRFQKSRVAGGLITAKARFLVGDQLLDRQCLGDSFIG